MTASTRTNCSWCGGPIVGDMPTVDGKPVHYECCTAAAVHGHWVDGWEPWIVELDESRLAEWRENHCRWVADGGQRQDPNAIRPAPPGLCAWCGGPFAPGDERLDVGGSRIWGHRLVHRPCALARVHAMHELELAEWQEKKRAAASRTGSCELCGRTRHGDLPWCKGCADMIALCKSGIIGPVWTAAACERNWSAIRIVPRTNDRLDKIPIDPDRRRGVSHEQAARLTLAEATLLVGDLDARHPSRRHVLGYMPRPGSAMVCGDVDECALNEGEPPHWLRDLDRKLTTYVERSPSGRGLRVLMARASATRSVPETGGVALYADAGKALTITFDHLAGSPRAVEIAWPAQQAFAAAAERIRREVMGAQRLSERRGGESDAPHWFADLDEARQLELVEEMLAALPEGAYPDRDPNSLNSWFRIICAVSHGLDGDGYELVDAWSRDRAGGSYDPAENWRIWQSIGESNQDGDRITIGTLIRLAQDHGWQRPHDVLWPSSPFADIAHQLSPEQLANLDARFKAGLARRRVR